MPWQSLGIKCEVRSVKLFLRGVFWSATLVLLFLLLLFYGGWVQSVKIANPYYFLNALFLIIVVGFAEELVFRGWLLEEMVLLLGLRKGIIIQYAIGKEEFH